MPVKKKGIGLLLCFFMCALWLQAQNLVKNPSFEEYSNCPNALGTFNEHVEFWSTPTAGSTDYFNTCSKIMGAPDNFNGEQEPKHGNAYAGIYFYAPADYREYIQSELRFTLKQGQEYELSFYASLAEGSDFAIKDFGVVVSDNMLQIPIKTQLSKGFLYKSKRRFQNFEIHHENFNENKRNWFKVSTTFVAKGYEKYLSIGNLKDNKSTRRVQTKRKETKKGAYYYIDQVSLIKKRSLDEPEMEFERDSLYVFKNIHFDFDEFAITGRAEQELTKIREALFENPQMLLQIHGHTDDLGTAAYNQNLSEKRALAVADYFVGHGIRNERISYFGHGNTKPFTEGKSEEERALNRRVEFLFTKKR